MEKIYDYIIIGSGASGFSLLIHFLEQPEFHSKKILILDKEQKNQNDRTWCFWQKGESPLDDITTKQWETLDFYTPETEMTLNIAPYRYKMIRSLDFYEKARKVIQKYDNVDYRLDGMKSIEGNQVECENGIYQAREYIFNSVPKPIQSGKKDHTLYQHFKGWFITLAEAEKRVFPPILMDFSIPQTYGCDFFYVLPHESGKMLVEFTSFSEKILEDEEYNRKLIDYVDNVLKLTNYTIEEEEFGVIPMTNAKIDKRQSQQVINIGIAGGNAKPSTGYTFTFIQKNSKIITQNLLKGKDPLRGIDHSVSRFLLYDSVFLRVLKEKKMPSWKIFDALFNKLPPDLILSFLNEETTFWEEFRVRNSMPQWLFMQAAMKEMGPFLQRV